ncbi:Collagen alpha-1(XXV) chain [Labeo rohita]|uniref:Collagen alpha-1(XXV) chain n=1 Tax=Labeo rohita TaxID=84645 RepID=A0ABQ8LKR3_LABRO|nr:Collagen alpha-1(XXV) chain [Labeo rohita]
MPKMVSTGDSKDVSKTSRCSGHHTSQIFHCLTTLVCFMLSASSVAVCLFMNVKTSHLERKIELLEMERLSVIQPVHSTLDAHSTLRDAIDKLVQERLKEGVSKIRTAREAAQECSCPPGLFLCMSLRCFYLLFPPKTIS